MAEHENIIPDYTQNTPSYLRRNDADSAATQTRPVYAQPPNDTLQRSPLDESWSKGSTTTPIPPPLPNKYINDYYNNNSEDNSYPGSVSKSTTKSLFDFNQYFTQSTTSSHYSFNTQQSTRTPLSFKIFASYSTTRNPYDFRNLNHYTSTRNTNDQASDSVKFLQNNYNQYYSSTTTKYPYAGFNYFSTTAKPENTSNSVYKQPYNNFNAFTTPSTTTTKKFHTFYFPLASQNSPSIISNMNIEASVSNVGDTEECMDRVTNISGSMTCQQFLTRYGFQYCSYKYMQRNCCASQRAICAATLMQK